MGLTLETRRHPRCRRSGRHGSRCTVVDSRYTIAVTATTHRQCAAALPLLPPPPRFSPTPPAPLPPPALPPPPVPLPIPALARRRRPRLKKLWQVGASRPRNPNKL